MSTTRTATRLTVAASLLVALIFALLPWGSAAAEETPRVTVSDLTLQRVDRTGATVDGGLALWSNARLGFSWSGDPKPTPSVEPELAHTGIAAGGALLTAGALIGAGLIIRNRRKH